MLGVWMTCWGSDNVLGAHGHVWAARGDESVAAADGGAGANWKGCDRGLRVAPHPWVPGFPGTTSAGAVSLAGYFHGNDKLGGRSDMLGTRNHYGLPEAARGDEYGRFPWSSPEAGLKPAATAMPIFIAMSLEAYGCHMNACCEVRVGGTGC